MEFDLKPALSIVIPCRNHRDELMEALRSIHAADKSSLSSWEVIVVDDGSEPALEGLVGGGSQTIRNSLSRGVGAARNQGAKAANYPFILFLDADVQIDALFFVEFEKLLNQWPHRNIFQGPYLPVPANKNIDSYGWYLAISRSHVFAHSSEEGFGQFLNSACVIMRREFFLAVGGFSEQYQGSGGEEFEFIKRLKPKEIIQTPSLGSRHFSDSFSERLRKLYRRSQNYPFVLASNQSISLFFKLMRCGEIVCVTGLTLSLLAALFYPMFGLVLGLLSAVGIAMSNASLTIFVWRKGSFSLMLKSIPFRYVEIVVMIAGMTLGLLKYCVQGIRREVKFSYRP